MVTMDATSLYTNINHDEGMNATKGFLNNRPTDTKPSTDFLMNLINFILTCNCFRFKDNFYLQQKGTAMGTRMAPSYANLFMANFENNFLNSQHDKPLLWFRYIDDIFMIWTLGQDKLNTFLETLNSFNAQLKFTWNISSYQVTYLDLDVQLKNGVFSHKINIKPTNSFQYLHYHSCHPLYVKKSIPKSLATRAKKLCSNEEDFINYIKNLKTSLLTRKYPAKLIDSKIKSIPDRNSQKTHSNFNDEPKLITQYHPGLYKINNVLRIAFSLLKNSPLTNQIFKKVPRIVFKKPPTLRICYPNQNYQKVM